MIGSIDDELWNQILIECGAENEITEKEFLNILLN